MSPEQIAKIFLEKKYQLNMGAGKLSKYYKTDIESIYKAKEIARRKIESTKKLPKILILDIETAPMKAYIWSRWNQDINPSQMISEWFMITWSAKWLFSSVIYNDTITPEEIKKEDDSRITKSIWKLLDEADIIIAHNGDRFDIPKLNSRFIVHGLVPPSPYQTIDTKKVASKEFGFSSNKLSELAKQFGLDAKLDTNFKLWSDSMNGDIKSLTYMQQYNDQDIIVLEELYLKLRPWIKNHPNLGVYVENNEPTCKVCSSKKLTYIDKYHYTTTGKFEVYRCDDCGALNRRRLNSYDKDKKENLLV